jgi:hypothetical protein
MPGLAHFSATPDVGNCGDYPTVHHAEHLRVEEDVVGDAVSPIAVQIERASTIERRGLEPYQ